MSHPLRIANEISSLLEFLEAGVDFIHLRKPHFDEKELEKFIHQIPEQNRKRLIVHGKVLIAEKYGLGGVHFSHENPATRDSLRSKISKSIFSTHPDDLSIIDQRYKRVFLGPVFTHTNYRSNIQWPWTDCTQEQFRRLKASRNKCIAIGGVDLTNIQQTAEWGFNGALLYTSIWEMVESQGMLNTLSYFEQVMGEVSSKTAKTQDSGSQIQR